MNEETKTNPSHVDTEQVEYTTPAASKDATTRANTKSRKAVYIAAAIVFVLILLSAIWYVMERTDRVSTNFFGFIERAQLEREAIARVNDVEISAYDLSISEQQIAAAAAAQGVDVNDADPQASITEQAVEMLINTELLRQEAESRGISIDDEAVDARYEQLVQEVGGESVLEERMEQFGVTDSVLKRDIRNELVIQTLLDQVFAESSIEVSDAEVEELYNSAGGAEGGLPPLEEVRAQIEAQVQSTKEQEIVDDFIESLRNQSTVEVLIEV